MDVKHCTIGLLSILLLALFVSACATATGGNPEIFRVGELEVRLYQDRGEMVKNLPPIFALLEASMLSGKQITVSGYFDRENKRIYAINDARTVIHEFKHYLEPDWRHGIGSPLLPTSAV